MPINSIRLNHRPHTHPNDRIIFIKPRPRPPAQQRDYETADLFLRAIAAQCLPIMKKHWLSVTTLEEHEPNPQFLGQNFNHGECIQLVLRGKGGGWLRFEMVAMIMMHELAHNLEMNHGKKFWERRNEFAGELRELWTKGYTGEGFWSGGRRLGELGDGMGENVVGSQELKDMPLCGGVYRTRRRKRKAGAGKKDELTWKEKKERRIEKKFGKNGVSLGVDEDVRLGYEIGKGPVGGNPRVAQSKRGRELRAAAALARFEKSKQEPKDEVKEEDTEDGEYEDEDAELKDAMDTDGQRLLDAKGQSMVKICGEEDEDDVHVKQEMDELVGLERYFPRPQHDQPRGGPEADETASDAPDTVANAHEPDSDATTATATPSPEPQSPPPPPKQVRPQSIPSISAASPSKDPLPPPLPATTTTTATATATTPAPPPSASPAPPTASVETTCPICSLANNPFSPTCAACSHVLDPLKSRNHWRCQSEACQGSEYVNSGDAGVCGVCGARKRS